MSPRPRLRVPRPGDGSPGVGWHAGCVLAGLLAATVLLTVVVVGAVLVRRASQAWEAARDGD